jgi:uncharacterized membrane protein YfcA
VHVYPFTPTIAVELVLLGFAVGTLGTLVGAGGGFILTPVLLIAYPRDKPDLITAISLVVVFFNALSGSFAYRKQRRIDYRSGLQFAAAALPGSVAGALVVGLVPTKPFDVIMGVMLAALAALVLSGGERERSPSAVGARTPRSLTDAEGRTYEYAVPMRRGIGYSVFVGFVSSFLGIGGGVIHVPLMVAALGFPVHIATATSHFVLTFMAATGSVTHVLSGTFANGVGLRRAAALSVGVIGGAQLGAMLSRRISGKLIKRLLGAALLLIAARVITQGF